MKSIQKIVPFVLLSFIFIACEDDDPVTVQPPAPICANVPSDFQSLFDSLASAGYTDEVTLDTEIHAYTFTLSVDKEVCQIGYQSHHDSAATPYVIELVDPSTNTILYSHPHVFSGDSVSYVEPSASLKLKGGLTYTLRRIQTNWRPYVGNTIGQILWKDTMDFPYTHGVMTITGAEFEYTPGSLTNWAIPYIDLIFK